jgi:hypothetical protein
MKRLAFLVLVAGWFVPLAFAQEDHYQVGVFADYFRLSQTHTNLAGLGARFGTTVFRGIQLEGEMGYDFDQAFTESFTNGTGTVTLQRSNLRALHGEFGPKLSLGHLPFHPFVTLKGGFMNFNLSNAPATVGTFLSSVDNLRRQNTNAVLYPGGGLDGHLGPVGLRLDIGDEMYFNRGTHSNLRISVGPYLRF